MAQSDTTKLTNPVKEIMQAGGVALGMTVRLGRSPDIARIAKATGHDFVFIDTQHSIFDLETIAAIAHTALAIADYAAVMTHGDIRLVGEAADVAPVVEEHYFGVSV